MMTEMDRYSRRMAAWKMHPHGIDVSRGGLDILRHVSKMFRASFD
jgi:hypothetical protein